MKKIFSLIIVLMLFMPCLGFADRSSQDIVTATNSAYNNFIQDVIGNKNDTTNGSSIVSIMKMSAYDASNTYGVVTNIQNTLEVIGGVVTNVNNETFSLNTTLTNIENGSARYTNVSLIVPSGWFYEPQTQNCNNLTSNESCKTEFNVTIPNGTLSDIYLINITANWTNPDDSFGNTIIQFSVNVTDNALINITPTFLSGTVLDGGESYIGNFTIFSLGNLISSAIILAVRNALFAGLEIIISGLTFIFSSRFPISGASRFPRLFNGRSKSARSGFFQLDLACLTR